VTRIHLRARPAILFAGLLLIGLIIFLPMRLALGWAGLGEEGFTARRVTGSIWDGVIRDAMFGDVALGSLEASVSPLSLLVGHARISVDGRATGIEGALHGALVSSRTRRGVDALSGVLPTGRAFAPLPVTQLTLDAVTVNFVGDTCTDAKGRVTAALGGDVAGVALPAEVSGNARCDDGALLLPLASQSGNETIALRVTGAGAYTAALTLVPSDPATAAKLAALGFVAAGNGYQLSVDGRF
jgi:general secretion pathway protein N